MPGFLNQKEMFRNKNQVYNLFFININNITIVTSNQGL